jgi:hypothetical protein
MCFEKADQGSSPELTAYLTLDNFLNAYKPYFPVVKLD